MKHHCEWSWKYYFSDWFQSSARSPIVLEHRILCSSETTIRFRMFCSTSLIFSPCRRIIWKLASMFCDRGGDLPPQVSNYFTDMMLRWEFSFEQRCIRVAEVSCNQSNDFSLINEGSMWESLLVRKVLCISRWLNVGIISVICRRRLALGYQLIWMKHGIVGLCRQVRFRFQWDYTFESDCVYVICSPFVFQKDDSPSIFGFHRCCIF